jgi:hypothetical protein
MELARNAEVPARALKQRARTRQGATLYVGEPERRGLWTDEPQVDFADADMSAFLLVWKRHVREEPPGITDAPDEMWSLTPRGAVVKEDCRLPVRRPAPAVQPPRTAFLAPAPVEDDGPVLPPRTVLLAPGDEGDIVVIRDPVAPLRALCKACDKMPRTDGRCGCS